MKPRREDKAEPPLRVRTVSKLGFWSTTGVSYV
jgi:hypothetical protein